MAKANKTGGKNPPEKKNDYCFEKAFQGVSINRRGLLALTDINEQVSKNKNKKSQLAKEFLLEWGQDKEEIKKLCEDKQLSNFFDLLLKRYGIVE